MDAVGAQRGALLNCEKGTFTIQAVRGNDLRLSTAVRPRVIEGKQSLLIRDVEQDILLHPDQSVGLAIGDVAGKGMPAALLMSSLQAKVQAIAETSSSPAALVTRLNRSMAAACPDNRFVTFFFSLLNLRSGDLTFCNAGHNPPLLARSDGSVQRLEGGGPVLGILPGLSYQERSCVMEDGDMLLLYSDGVTEAQSPSGEEFGEERLEGILGDSREDGVEALLAIVLVRSCAKLDGRATPGG